MQKFHSLDSRHRLREKLIAVIEASDTDWEGELEDNASLIRSGRLDSLGLFNVTLFVEREIGRPMDFTAFDLAKEWDTVSDILNFIDKLASVQIVSRGRECLPGPRFLRRQLRPTRWSPISRRLKRR